ncbi:prepilin peptidase [Virgibacillus sp. W0181]|uniref:prepilin peptidase n=1 Tax=Virgibacillus sp. W0181 TaxID=3391581 RepID=UPI003F448287
MNEIIVTILFFVAGITLGSFFNVVGLRLPQGETFTTDRSVCPACKKQLSWFELIPVLSYLVQRGRCRKCYKNISVIYPLIEGATGMLFAFSYQEIGLNLELIIVLFFVSMLMILFVSDITYMVIPNKVLLFFLPIFILLRYIKPLDPWWSSILGAVTGFVIIALVIVLSRGGMGAGDMKLFGVIGIVLGFSKVLFTFLFACMVGAIIGVGLLLLEKIERKQPIPFGPYIIFAAFVSYFYGDAIITWYMQMFS